MKLLFLSKDNLSDSFFIKTLVAKCTQKEPFLLLHDHFGKSFSDTRFVTKRISSMLSESMVVNTFFSGSQRNILTLENEKVNFHPEAIQRSFENVQAIILNPIAKNGSDEMAADPLEMLNQIRIAFNVDELVLFPKNSKSPLAAERKIIRNKADSDQLLKIFEEESAAILNALALAPVSFASPDNLFR